MYIFVILILWTIASAQDACDTAILCTTIDSQECINAVCENVSPPFVAQIEPVINTCTAFDNCEEYITACTECEWDKNAVPPAYVCKDEGDSCDPIAPPTDVCKQCMDGYAAPYIGSTCCVAAPNAQAIELFTQIDTNSVGYVSATELEAFVASLPGNPITAEQTTEIFTMADTNGDILISEDEFVNADVQIKSASDSVEGVEGEIKPDKVASPDSVEGVDGEIKPDKVDKIKPDRIDSVGSPDSVEVVGDAGAMANDNNNNNTPDMFGIKDAKPAQTYSILSVIIIAGVVILIVMSWGMYQYMAKRKAVKELNEMEQINLNENENDDENTIIVTEEVR